MISKMSKIPAFRLTPKPTPSSVPQTDWIQFARIHLRTSEDRIHDAREHVDLTPTQSRVNAWFAYSGAIVAQTGVQMVAPSLPVMRDALGLSDAQLSLVMSVYLLPAAVGAIPIGILADRIGRRRVFGGSMIVFGFAGIALQLSTHSFGLFLAIRVLQGISFAGLLPLTMTILGDAYRGAALIRSQGGRSVSMLIGDGSLPILGGALVAISWQTPWLGQVLAIPFGLAVLLKMTDPASLEARTKRPPRLGQFVRLFRTPAVIAVQYAGFWRMVVKFSVLTFLPVLLVDVRDFSPAAAGLVVGASALIGIIPSMSAGRIAGYARASTYVGLGVAGQGFALAIWTLVPWAPAIFFAAFAFGISDGLSGVYVNSIVASATETETRASFVAATGAIRNFAKFLGPAALGLLILVVTLPTAFGVLAAISVASGALAFPLRGLDAKLRQEGPHGGDT